ncbi:tafazzin [Apiospora hydei]|uniref:Tafazzin n=1 Tax=Apiospora hydei TaxID=1337664 RepID=A0ABR1W8W4_9PEZI
MPKKKRYQSQYAKPPSTAPPSLSLSRGASSQTNPVNDILSDLRRSNLNSAGASHASLLPQNAPSVPPAIRHIFQIPDTPAPAPRRPQRRGPNGRRVPPGPPPPRSWLALSQSRHAPSAHQHPAASHIQNWPLPGAYYPDDGSLVDITLRHMATDWVTQRDWNRFYLYTLSGGMRSALLHYVSTLHEDGISAADIRLVLGGPPESELAEYELEKPDVNKLNKDIFHLDLTGSIGKSLSLKSLTDLLFVTTRQQQGEVEVQDSWDAPELISEPTKLLPNLTHLSLAMSPNSTSSASWKQLLTLASKLPTLTHLNLSGWPAPSLTPNAMAAKVVSPVTGRAANYGATNHYSHILDDDWSEAVLILRKLSKALYSLVYLDLTGCGDWFPALRKEAEGESSTSSVDWASDWGKIEVLRLCSGYVADPDSTAHLSRLWDWKRQAVVVEKNIRSQRAGRGRFITVEMDKLPDLVESPVGVNAGLAHNA